MADATPLVSFDDVPDIKTSESAEPLITFDDIPESQSLVSFDDVPELGVKAMAMDAINRVGKNLQSFAGKVLDPFQETREDMRTMVQLLSGDFSGEKTNGGETLIPLTPGEKVTRQAEERSTNPAFDEYKPDPSRFDPTVAPALETTYGVARAAAGTLGYLGGAALGAPAAPETLGASSIAAGTAGAIAADVGLEETIKRAAAYGFGPAKRLLDALEYQHAVDVPGVGPIKLETLGSISSIGPLTANTIRNVARQYVEDVARKSADYSRIPLSEIGKDAVPGAVESQIERMAQSYAASKVALQGTAAMTGAATADALAQEILTGKVDPQQVGIASLLGLATMQPGGRALWQRSITEGTGGRVEDFASPKKEESEPMDGGWRSWEADERQLVLDDKRGAIPSREDFISFQPKGPNESSGILETANESQGITPMVGEGLSTEATAQAQDSQTLDASREGFVLHDGVYFDPALTSLDEMAQKSVGYLADGIRANGLKNQRIAIVNDPDLPAVYASPTESGDTLYLNTAKTEEFSQLNPETRKRIFDRFAVEEYWHNLIGYDDKQLLQVYQEMTPESRSTAAREYGGHIGYAYDETGENPDAEVQKGIAAEYLRSLAQSRSEEPHTELVAFPERFKGYTRQTMDILSKQGEALKKAPVTSQLLDRAEGLDKERRTPDVPYNARYNPEPIQSRKVPENPDVSQEFASETNRPGRSLAESANQAESVPAKGRGIVEAPIPNTNKQIESPQFKKWFGDSKVIDKKGKPLVVYHGTNQEFLEFSKEKLGSTTGSPSASKGFFFTSNPEVASAYSELSNRETPNYKKYLEDLRNRFRLASDKAKKTQNEDDLLEAGELESEINFREENPSYETGDGANVIPSYISLKNPLIYDFKGQRKRRVSFSNLLHEAKIEGHDGAILKNTFDDPSGTVDYPHDIYIAFEPEQIKSAIGNSGVFDPNNPKITGAPSLKDIGKKARDVAKAGYDNYLTPYGPLPKGVEEIWHEAEAKKSSIKTNAELLLRDLKRAIKEVHGNRAPKGVELAREMEVVNDALQGQREIKGPLEAPIKAMREYIDNLSDELIRSGAIDAPLIPHIEANKGFYLTRSYRAFDDPKWMKNWEKKVGPEAANRARSMVASWLAQEYAQPLYAEAKREFLKAKEERYRQMSSEELAKQAGPSNKLDAEDMDAIYEGLMEKGHEWLETPDGQLRLQGEINSLTNRSQSGARELFSAGTMGGKNLSILKRRKEIPFSIREMMGEYKTADVNFLRSAGRMAVLWQNQVFLNKMREMGMGKFLFEKPTGDFSEQIAADGSSTLAPLNGLHTTPEIAKTLKNFNVTKELPFWARSLTKINLIAKMGKTVLNPSSIGHNFFSQPFWWAMNGNTFAFNPRNWKIPLSTLAEREGWDGLRSLAGKDSKEARAYLSHMMDLGVIEPDPRSGDIQATIKDALRQGETLETLSGAWNKGLRFAQSASKTHEIPNSFSKILLFNAERARYAKALPEATPSELDEIAANVVRMTTPTYSQIPKVIKSLRRFPMMGPFISFWSESYRTWINTPKLAAQEIKNPATRGIGLQRLIGWLLTTGLLVEGVRTYFMTENGIDSDEEHKLRKFLPEWSENAQLMWLSNDGKGKLTYWDPSYIIQTSLMTAVANAALNGENVEESAINAAGSLFKPVLDEQIGYKAIDEAFSNSRETPSGSLQKVSNAPDSTVNQYWERIKYALKAIRPGFVDSAERIYEASQGNIKKYGAERTMEGEIAKLFGFNVQTLDLRQALKYQASAYQQNINDAASRYNLVFKREGKVSDSELKKALDETEVTRKSEFKRMSDLVSAARNLGVPIQDVVTSLVDAGLGRKEIGTLITGNYVPYLPSKSSIRKAYENAQRQGNQEEKNRLKILMSAE